MNLSDPTSPDFEQFLTSLIGGNMPNGLFGGDANTLAMPYAPQGPQVAAAATPVRTVAPPPVDNFNDRFGGPAPAPQAGLNFNPDTMPDVERPGVSPEEQQRRRVLLGNTDQVPPFTPNIGGSLGSGGVRVGGTGGTRGYGMGVGKGSAFFGGLEAGLENANRDERLDKAEAARDARLAAVEQGKDDRQANTLDQKDRFKSLDHAIQMMKEGRMAEATKSLVQYRLDQTNLGQQRVDQGDARIEQNDRRLDQGDRKLDQADEVLKERQRQFDTPGGRQSGRKNAFDSRLEFAKQLYPDDIQAQGDYAAGRKQVSPVEVGKKAIEQANKDYEALPYQERQKTNREQYLRQRAETWAPLIGNAFGAMPPRPSPAAPGPTGPLPPAGSPVNPGVQPAPVPVPPQNNAPVPTAPAVKPPGNPTTGRDDIYEKNIQAARDSLKRNPAKRDAIIQYMIQNGLDPADL